MLPVRDKDGVKYRLLPASFSFIGSIYCASTLDQDSCYLAGAILVQLTSSYYVTLLSHPVVKSLYQITVYACWFGVRHCACHQYQRTSQGGLTVTLYKQRDGDSGMISYGDSICMRSCIVLNSQFVIKSRSWKDINIFVCKYIISKVLPKYVMIC